MADVFISYKRERRPAARHLEQILARYGYSVWFDLALVRGADYEEQIQRELNAAKAVIVLWCGHSVQSGGVRSEASRAKAQGKLVPVVIERCELPLFSTLEQNIDLTAATGSPRDHALDPILDDLERLVGRAPVADLKALREYEATWRSLGGGLPLAKLPLEQVAVPEDGGSVTPMTAQSQPSHDYAFWERQWEKPDTRTNLVALRAIAEEAPRFFADQARQHIAEIEAEAEHKRAEEAAAREAEARQLAERERIARDLAAEEERYRKEGRIRVTVGNGKNDHIAWATPGAGEPFRDIDIGPEMVVVPTGQYMMGEAGSQRQVAIEKPFAIGQFTLTFDEWDAAQAHPEWQRHAGINARKANDHGWGRGKQPSIDVSWEDAKAYCKWLSALTAKSYRLPTEAEWEYCCRAGTTTAFSTGDQITKKQAQFSEGSYGSAKQTVKVGSFPPNAWGLHDMHGNVWEWCEDKYEASSSSRVLRGGSWDNNPSNLRSASRNDYRPDYRNDNIGFRLARTL
jgi:formylglycine-generating enzyme required for sulfatase activity